jgi:transcriptional regulator with XRE-family HTH domain
MTVALEVEDMTEQNNPLGTRIQAFLRTSGWSVARLAQESGLSATYIQNLARGMGKRPSLDTLQRLAQAMGYGRAEDLTGPSSGPAPRVLPTEDLHPLVEIAASALGKYLTPRDFAFVAGYLRGVAEERRRDEAEAHGYHVDDEGHAADKAAG